MEKNEYLNKNWANHRIHKRKCYFILINDSKVKRPMACEPVDIHTLGIRHWRQDFTLGNLRYYSCIAIPLIWRSCFYSHRYFFHGSSWIHYEFAEASLLPAKMFRTHALNLISWYNFYLETTFRVENNSSSH